MAKYRKSGVCHKLAFGQILRDLGKLLTHLISGEIQEFSSNSVGFWENSDIFQAKLKFKSKGFWPLQLPLGVTKQRGVLQLVKKVVS